MTDKPRTQPNPPRRGFAAGAIADDAKPRRTRSRAGERGEGRLAQGSAQTPHARRYIIIDIGAFRYGGSGWVGGSSRRGLDTPAGSFDSEKGAYNLGFDYVKYGVYGVFDIIEIISALFR